MMRGLLTAERRSNIPQARDLQKIGEVVTTWLLYGPRPRYSGTIIASLYPELHGVLP
ncbi:hypothetical protein ACVWW6_008975 [Bradyrhizobium sp. USDA 3311]